MLLVEILRVADGVLRTYRYDGVWEEHSNYMWFDGGNYSCDCNRAIFFASAADEEPPDDRECGDTAYRMRILDADGKELGRDDDWPEQQ